jgi:hypothetical protein
MHQEVFSFQGRFQLWSFTVSHSQILIRSVKSEKRQTRIDVLFKDVSSLSLPTILDDFSIVEIDNPPDTHEISKSIYFDRKSYRVLFEGGEGIIVAGAMGWHEDNGEYFDPSFFASSL